MAKILCLETATTNCSVALGINGEVVSFLEDNSPGYSHAEQLHVFIEKVFDNTGISLKDLDAIAVSKGPGSYTGLRIGVSAAKGLCFSLDIPLIAIFTLESMALQIQVGHGEVIIPVLDARRMEVYSCVFDESYTEIRQTKAEIIDQDAFKDYLTYKRIHLVGSGAEKCKEVLINQAFEFYSKALPSAKDMVPLAENKYTLSTFEDVAYFEPYYLKDFVLQGKKQS